MFGMPDATVLAFAVTVFAGCLAAIHYLIVHVVLGKPIREGRRR